MADKTRPAVSVTSLREGDEVVLFGQKQRVLGVHVTITVEGGLPISAPLNLMVDVVVAESVDRCPNGQDGRECREIDPCEACWQDQQEEGDEIERSMGLRPDLG